MEQAALCEFDRYAAIVQIIREAERCGYRLQRADLVNLIYLLQEVYGVPLGYDFSFCAGNIF
ncbi:hypothetical protein SAMN02746089_02566 [Caldanaerobius fijiensis DSM 17918]|uniref:Uncharacterized protein n=1 Tax=Caldanaerobius fijiensis DSM 17918 TaxID=1121256 RepID=A0A1M5EKS7_9THEO|nr:hypothetical protein [Caldanaerobius fijiensis]SHF79744.1 hypothetical protein SAMN02746089_02566 [Caldanaerobius fijiensis DSM 17918]